MSMIIKCDCSVLYLGLFHTISILESILKILYGGGPSTSHPQAWLLSKEAKTQNQQITTVGENMETLEPFCAVSEKVK